MKYLPTILIFLITISCNNNNNNNTNSIKKSEPFEEKKASSELKVEYDSTQITDRQNEVMKVDEILFNGKLSRYFSLVEFEKVFGKSDSIKQLAKEEPCTFIFDTELKNDNSNFDEFLYYYKEGSRFENYKEKIAVDEFRFTNSNFILYKGVKLNSSTTIDDLQKLFPNAIDNVDTMDVYGEGNLQVIQLREDENNISDGHINIFIKNGKLYYMHWWFPC
ncbi:hypothetical protein J2X31_003558 [Flavobacterium arsenatis]|uniref:Lipoprotein n=1 Tax=Flavobacterium arsenatis TaxID=1484332 RepID=A0ABU1TUH9_9FLAO|nr:hypothetical protein [Flavobacterium arsenatis]MDR6969525.1 hypothetical protein [Flavobacterium arsenatis]